MFRQVTKSRWFSFFDLACVSASCMIWYFRPSAGGWPLLLALLPWLLRVGAGLFPFKRTPFDLPLLLFLLTAGLGVWASYDPQAAWAKFWLIVGSVLLYYALAGQPESNLWPIYGLVGILGAAVALTTLFDANLGNYTPDLGLIQRFSQWWEAARPAWQVTGLEPNVSGGLLAVLLPFPIVLAGYEFLRGKIVLAGIAVLPVAVMGIGLFITSSRGAWIAFAAAWTVVLFWFGHRFLAPYLSRKFQLFLAAAVLVTLAVVLGYFVSHSEGLGNALDRLPGLPSGASRLDLALATTNLISDFPFTGGGLRAFPGLYSRYILVIPFLFFEYSHNLYLDVFLEQGLLGGLTLMIVLLGSLLLAGTSLMKNREFKSKALLQLAVLAGLVVLLIHGLVDDALYGMRGTPLLFLIPGIGVALRYPSVPVTLGTGSSGSLAWRRLIWASAVICIPGDGSSWPVRFQAGKGLLVCQLWIDLYG
jgi:putative inorganic carbon (hco3(-)) transporter